MSTNTGVAPTLTMASVVATNVCGVVSTSLPSPMPKARKEHNNAVVPEPVLAQSSAPTYRANAVSNLLTSGPVMKLLLAIT